MFHSKYRSGAAHAAHHFVENEQDAVVSQISLIRLKWSATGPTAPSVAPTTGSATKANDPVGPELDDLRLEFDCESLGVSRMCFARLQVSIGVTGGDVMGFGQNRLELRAAPFVSACCQSSYRVSVIALPARDNVAALRLADFHVT
ncbi:hypothetical protein ACVINY_004030 [Sinorhizobium meliloti]